MQLVQPTARFQLALDALLPMLYRPHEVGRIPLVHAHPFRSFLTSCVFAQQLAQRILVSYILYSLYAAYPISINPFKSVLLSTYVQERQNAIQIANEGGYSDHEQLVWVLWKILKGDGNDVCHVF